jgi:hypothetical protein
VHTASPHDKPTQAHERRLPSALWVACAQMFVSTSCTETVPIDLPPPSQPTATAATTKASPDDEPRETPVAFIIEHPVFPVQTQDGLINGKAVPARRRLTAELYHSRLGDEIRLYPDTLLKQIKLRQIVLCDELSFNATKCFSFTDVEQGTIYMNVQTNVDDDRIRWTIHHELFHQLDYAGDSRLDPDPAWESLNPIGFRYFADAERLQTDPAAAGRETGIKGFVNRYATASPTEDKAELYALLVVEPEEARRRLADDDVLRRKAAKIRQMIDAFGPYSALLIGR